MSIHSTGRVSLTLLGSYAVTKYGVQAFSDALRREMNPWGIKVSIVEPGGFRTEITSARLIQRQLQEGWNGLNDELKQEYMEKGNNSIYCRTAVVQNLQPSSPTACI